VNLKILHFAAIAPKMVLFIGTFLGPKNAADSLILKK
jgi:hypothetical protein